MISDETVSFNVEKEKNKRTKEIVKEVDHIDCPGVSSLAVV